VVALAHWPRVPLNRRMGGLFLRWYEFFARRPLALVAGIVALLGLSAAGAWQLKFSEDVFGLLPHDEPMVAETRLALDRFEGLERVVIVLQGDDVAALARDVDEAENRLRKTPDVSNVVARISEEAQNDIALNYLGKAPLLFDKPMQDAVAARLSRAEFEKRLQDYLDRQAGSQGIAVADTFRDDPFGFNELVLRRFEKLNSGFEGSLVGGRLFSRDQKMAVILVEAAFHASNTGRGREFMPRLEEALSDLPGAPRVHIIGAHRSSADNAAVLRSDLNLTIATSAIGVLLLFLVAFRALTPVFLAFTSAGFGFALALGIQGFGWGDLSAITAGFAGVLMGISVDYAIHLTSSFAGMEGTPDQRARAALRHVAMPSFVAMLTTGVALATLRLSSFDGLHQLSEMGIAGLVGALLFALIVGPQVLRKRPPALRRQGALGKLLGGIETFRRKLRWPLLAALAGVTLALAACLPLVGFDGDITNLDGKSAQTRAAEQQVQQGFGQESLRRTLLVAGGDTLQQALRQNDVVARELVATGARFESVSWGLPAEDTQRENMARWRAFWNEDRIAQLKGEMAAARAQRPDSPEPVRFAEAALEKRFGAFFAGLRLKDDLALLDAQALRKRPVWSLLANYVSEQQGRFYAGSTAHLEPQALGGLRARLPAVLILNKAAFVSRMVSFIQRDLLLMGGLSLLLVIAVLWLTFGRLREMLIALVPVAGSLVWTLGLMGLLGIPFNIINTLVTVFIAGLGIDYGIFFVQTWRESASSEEASMRLRLAGTGVLVAAMTTLFGFGTLAMARHPALFSVGITTVLGIVSSLVLTLLVVPTLLEFRKPQ